MPYGFWQMKISGLIQIFLNQKYFFEFIRNTFVLSQMDDFLFSFYEDHKLRWRLSNPNTSRHYTQFTRGAIIAPLLASYKKTIEKLKKQREEDQVKKKALQLKLQVEKDKLLYNNLSVKAKKRYETFKRKEKVMQKSIKYLRKS
jgi:hypothetical protein